MEVGLLAQYLAIALAVLLSAGFVLRHQFPAAARRLRIALALPMLREGKPVWMQRLGRALAPAARPADDGCGGCNGCD